MNLLLALILAAMVASAWAAFFVLVPAQMGSLTRYELWKLRDELVDGLLSNNVMDSKWAWEVVASIEAAIRFTPHMSLFNIKFALPDPPAHWIAEHQEFVGREKRSLPADQAKMIEQVQDRLRLIVARHALRRSLSGWISLVCLAPVAMFYVALGMLHAGARNTWQSAKTAFVDNLVPADRLAYRYDLGANARALS